MNLKEIRGKVAIHCPTQSVIPIYTYGMIKVLIKKLQRPHN